MIRVESVWKRYDTVVAVRDFSFSVARGMTMGLIGPNGSGKTTLLRMISTLAKPDSGSIRIGGVCCLENPRAIRRQLAFMPAEYGYPPNMTIREYLDYFACAAGVPRHQRDASIDEILELTELRANHDVLIRGLSTGNRQRLLLAKTLLGDQELLLLDEPASGLDPRARAEVRALLKELAKMGKTIVISSHILADLEDICDSVCIIEQGRMIASDNIEELRGKHRAPNRLVHLRVAEGKVPQAAALIGNLDDVLKCEIFQGRLEVASVNANCNFILRCLLDNDIEVLELVEDRPNLEDIFIASTKGVVS